MPPERSEVIVYELWSDDDLRWIEITVPTIELAAFLEAWCEKEAMPFRRRVVASATLRRRRATAADGWSRVSIR